jgi:arginine repressor
LKKIIIRDPQNIKVLKRLEYVETLMNKGNVGKQEEIVEELEQWLDNLRQRKPYNE